MVVLLFRVGNLLGRLVVAELTSFCQDSDIGRRIDLLKHHFELIEEAEGNASLPLHNLIHHLGVELDVKVAQSRLQLLKVLQSVGDRISVHNNIQKL